MRVFAISCALVFIGCSSVQVHVITCSNIDKCYESAYVKCRGHWSRVTKAGSANPANYIAATAAADGEYTLNVRCKR